MKDLDSELMLRALTLGANGDPTPNPHVGAVIADAQGNVIAEGFHQAAGLDHAEVVALKKAGSAARDQTLYVTLEPCNHHGRTPPCVDAILAAGIKRVVIGVPDPDPRVPGGGMDRLRAAGVEVTLGVQETEAKALIQPWSKYVTEHMSFVTLKLAISLDGRIATRTGASKWITCPEARLRVQTLRARHDAVMVGINTVLTDDPRLTVRDLPGRNPIRVVVDSKLRIPLSANVVQSAGQIPTCVVTTLSAPIALEQALEQAGVRVIRVPATAEGRCDPVVTFRELAAREVVSVMCEGGSELAGSLLAHRVPDQLHVFVAPVLLGPRGRPGAVDWAGPENPSDAPRIDPAHWELCGTDAYVWGPIAYPKKTGRTLTGS
ncbi:MAG TPA: bifunctional diaminohydroxyphosphoribosylaminopyrimidine deaminase/5-amino-6-(5-phosphoribosylamino)uracil reductase RibD [Polyangiaceae bacterium]|jgi:diaminohydroxyphosphoribosylaminopyrimidine deaminase/5-amino-6-(5-phosphoribosylamino)uracil reductase|nr:bifunctional diaminohydroxyphosphoribosylaminopyrimidine deaminase/5-amino-6-(5-phosphoribosylamino)uracil reductase RibD [Polyangiaceae bacterium]